MITKMLSLISQTQQLKKEKTNLLKLGNGLRINLQDRNNKLDDMYTLVTFYNFF